MKRYFKIRVEQITDEGKENQYGNKIIDNTTIYEQIVDYVSIGQLASLINSVNEQGSIQAQATPEVES